MLNRGPTKKILYPFYDFTNCYKNMLGLLCTSCSDYFIFQEHSDIESQRLLHFNGHIMYCWGSTVHGELGLGGIEQDQIFSPIEHTFKYASSVVQGMQLSKFIYKCGILEFII